MITAQEARIKACAIRESHLQQARKDVENEIIHSVEEGRYNAGISIKIEDVAVEEIRKWLKDLGYTVDCCDVTAYECQMTISW